MHSNTPPSSAYSDFKAKLPVFNQPDLDLSLHQIIDFHLINNPEYPFGILAACEKSHASNDVITWNEIGSAIVKVAQDLNQMALIDPSIAPVIGIIASNEPLVHFTMLLAIMRAGCVPFAISPRNSAAAISHLLQSTGCKSLYVQFNPFLPTQDLENISSGEKLSRNQIKEVLQVLPDSYHINLLEFPSANTLFPRLTNCTPYKPQPELPSQLAKIKILDRPIWAPVLILHSSGTTAFPKPIYFNRITLKTWLTAPLNTQFSWQGEITASMVLPSFHAMGLHFGFLVNLSTGSISGFFRPEFGIDGRYMTKNPNSVNVMKAMKSLDCTLAAFSPMMISELASDPTGVEFLRRLKRVGFGGGPLATGIGNELVAKGVKLSVMYGSTEVGCISTFFSEHFLGNDWEYFEFLPQLTTRLIPQSDGLYHELVILSSDKHRCSLSKIDTELTPQTYHTNDILFKHPTLPLYRVIGRLDEQIMLSNSEKTNPGPIETILNSNPAIKSSLMFGRGKPANGVIIEPEEDFVVDVTDREAVERYIDLIWPSIREANIFAPSHSRLTRDLVLVIDPRVNALPRTPKGQLARVKAIELFSDAIEALYENDPLPVDDKLQSYKHLLDPSRNLVLDSVLATVREIVNTIMDSTPHPQQDLFNQGCDSLAAKQIRSRIIQLLGSASETTPNVPQNLLYQHPTISGLSNWVFNTLKLKDSSTVYQLDSDPCASLKKMIQKYLPTVNVTFDLMSKISKEANSLYTNECTTSS
ncbi:hypothetical protein CROQUDRAFT_712790 [Cronartium quercuum f. sp. fusiforme G11]|uniref:Carrier domain-containing protein n=1 Tax=Cronartium quercuum f. sp. fusiforme G11 TaxID=708437 RepID=A0A9P6NU00_9BASI|nr:hypothetical protein CROQUDRAFT_712790 [Cronartium quercuum f. sp. fusiforme G11]